MPAEEDDRWRSAASGQRLLKLEAVEARHREIEHQATGCVRIVSREELAGEAKTCASRPTECITRGTALRTAGSSSTMKTVGGRSFKRGLLRQRQGEVKRRAAARVVRRVERPAVRGDDRAADCKSDPEAVRLRREKALEDPVRSARGQSTPDIADLDPHASLTAEAYAP